MKVAFLEVRKTYDRVWREGLWKKMEGYGFGGKFLRVLKELYKESTCMVRFGEIETDWFEVKEGLKQGCSLSTDNDTRIVFCGRYGRHGSRGRGFKGDVENGRGVWKGMENAV